MKQCTYCTKPITNKKSYCDRKCYLDHTATIPKKPKSRKNARIHVNTRMKKLKLMAVEYLGGKCALCGYNKCVGAMDFHHIDPSTKEFDISGRTISWDRLKAELDKCALLCANCHREVESGFTKL